MRRPRHQPQALPLQERPEPGRAEIGEFEGPARHHRVEGPQPLVDLARVAHHHRRRPECREAPLERRGDAVPVREIREAGKAAIGREAGPPGRCPEAEAEPCHHQSLAGLRARPDRAPAVARIAQPTPPPPRRERREQRAPDTGQHVDMLMPVDEIRQPAHRGGEGVDLALDLGADLRRVQAPRQAQGENPAERRQASVRREARHRTERRPRRQGQVEAEPDRAGELPQRGGRLAEGRDVGHRPGG